MHAIELAGQSIMLRFPGAAFDDAAREAFHRIRPGGVILFGDNVASRSQIAGLCRDLQAEARELGMPPLLIGIDQEGGLVSRLNADPAFVTPPGPMALTATGSREDIRRAAHITGEQLRQFGINVDFAPVVDVNNNHRNPVIRTRAFGDTVEAVIDGALATIEGLHEAGVAATVKHFPGHGDTHVDSHLGLPEIPHDMARLRAIELAPFQAAIDAGVPGVMTTHIRFPALDELPATLSHRILTGLLRQEMGFEGVIFTDSMSMRAIVDRYGVAEATVLAKRAGVDLLEANDTLEAQVTRHEALVTALGDGSIPRTTFVGSVARLDAVRNRFGIGYEVEKPGPAPETWREEAIAIARRGIVSLTGPLAPVRVGVIVDFPRNRGTEAEDPVGRGPLLRRLVDEHLPGTQVMSLPPATSDSAVEDVLVAVREAATVVILTRDAADDPAQAVLAERIAAGAGPEARVVHVALRSPYDVGLITRATDRVATYGDPAVTLVALVEVLAGRSAVTGRNPLRTI